jgi:hypothetical protein
LGFVTPLYGDTAPIRGKNPAAWLQPTIADDQKPSPERLWRLLMGLRGLFGLVFRSLRLHRKNLTARGVDANLFSIFRSWFGDVDGPETLSSRSPEFRAADSSARHLSQCNSLGLGLRDRTGAFSLIFAACYAGRDGKGS